MSQHHPPPAPPGHAHPAPAGALLGTAAALLALTLVTVITSRIDLGAYNIVLALAIAGVKATLVAAFFMHLRWERPFQTLVFATAVFFAVLLVGALVADSLAYRPDIEAARGAPRERGGTAPPAR